jgi:hypothetical protein
MNIQRTKNDSQLGVDDHHGGGAAATSVRKRCKGQNEDVQVLTVFCPT